MIVRPVRHEFVPALLEGVFELLGVLDDLGLVLLELLRLRLLERYR